MTAHCPGSSHALRDEPRHQTPAITPEQVWTARGLLRWSRDRLSGESDVTYGFIVKYERLGLVTPLFSRERGFDGLAAIRDAFERQGLQFLQGGHGSGVKRREPSDFTRKV